MMERFYSHHIICIDIFIVQVVCTTNTKHTLNGVIEIRRYTIIKCIIIINITGRVLKSNMLMLICMLDLQISQF